MRSVYDNVSVGGFLAYTNTTTGVVGTGASLDTKGYTTGVLRVWIPATAAVSMTPAQVGSLSVVLQESTDNSTFTTATDNSGATIGGTLLATTSAVISSYRIEGLGTTRLRYLRVRVTPTVNTSVAAPTFTSVAVIELGRGFIRPSMSGTSVIVVSNT